MTDAPPNDDELALAGPQRPHVQRPIAAGTHNLVWMSELVVSLRDWVRVIECQ